MIGNVGGARLAYHDRNPSLQSASTITGAIGPHAATVRQTYTVPSGKKARLSSSYNNVRRATAAAPVGRFQSYNRVFVVSAFTITSTMDISNVAGFVKEDSKLGEVDAVAGTVIQGITEDLSTGGTVDYGLSWLIYEYDA